VPGTTPTPPGADAPLDLPPPGTPIDFSGDGSAAVAPPSSPPITTYGGDATALLDLGDDPIADSALIQWFIGADLDATDDLPPIPTITTRFDGPNLARTQALPGIIVGKELVRQQTTLRVGQEVTVVSPLSDPSNPDANGMPVPYNANYRVAGTFFTGMYEYDLKYVYVTLASLQNFLALGDTVDGIEVRVESVNATGLYVPHGDSPGLIREALGPGYRVQDWTELNRSLFSALKLEKIAMFMILGIVILVASFAIVGNLIMVVVAKGRQIALLKTLGASDFGVLQLFTVQGLFIGILGSVLGVVSGLLVCDAIATYGIRLDPDVYYIDRLPIHVDPQSVLLTLLTGIAISIVATLHPSILAARVRPAAGMRH
jgi:lipoprotein-releasing system permease protein